MRHLVRFRAVWTGSRPIKAWAGELVDPFEVVDVPPAIYRERPGLGVRLLPVEDFAQQVCENANAAISWAKVREIPVVGHTAHDVRRALLQGIYEYEPARWNLAPIPGTVDEHEGYIMVPAHGESPLRVLTPEELKINDMRAMLKDKGLPAHGSREDLWARIQDNP